MVAARGRQGIYESGRIPDARGGACDGGEEEALVADGVSSIRLPYNWTPRHYQRKLWEYFRHGGKRSVACWPRRHGKDEVGLHHLACSAHERVGNYWYFLPEYAQARKSIWDAINPHSGKKRLEEALPLALRARTDDQEMKIVLRNGSTVQLLGSDNFLNLLGASPVGIVFSEWKIANPAAWAYLRPILLENDGWAYWNSTPQGKNHFYKLCMMAGEEQTAGRGWFYELLTNDDTHVFTEEELQAELRELIAEHGEVYGRAIWLQEYFCSFDAAITGSIWGDCMVRIDNEGRAKPFEVNKGIPVITGWDLGRTDDTAIWFAQTGTDKQWIFDYFSSAFMDICNEADPQKSLVHILLDRADKFGIRYDTHWLPHDARPRTLAAGGKSILQQFQDAAKKWPRLGRFAIAPRMDRQEGIVAARKTMQTCMFHGEHCEKGLEALRSYRREWDETNKVFMNSPKHDWSSHGADAFRTLATVWRYAKVKPQEQTLGQKIASACVTQQTMKQLTAKHFAAHMDKVKWRQLTQ